MCSIMSNLLNVVTATERAAVITSVTFKSDSVTTEEFQLSMLEIVERYVDVRVKLSLCLIEHYVMKAYCGVAVQIHVFLTSALVGGEWSASRPGRFTPGVIAPGIHWIGGGWTSVSVWTRKKKIDTSGTQTPTPLSASP
jgi:hypothetical protein